MAKDYPAIFGGEEVENQQVPEKYIYKEGYPQPVTDHESVPYMDPLFIDFSLLNSSSSTDPKAKEELHKFKSYLASWGCFQLINHGIPSSFLEEMRQVCKQFAELPMEEKQKYAMQQDDIFNGYSCGVYSDSEEHVHDWNEGLSLNVYPEARRNLTFWPEKPSQFKDMLHEYITRVTDILDILFKKILQSLNIDEEQFARQYGKGKEVNARFNFYPRCPSPDRVLGLKPHADFSPMTLILQDEPGLQVEKDGQWFMVPVVPDALFVNIGDSLEIMSNGIFKSAVHRVVPNAEKARTSLALFCDTDRHDEIGPLDELITDDRPQLYKRISYKDYTTIFFGKYNSAKRPIDNFRM